MNWENYEPAIAPHNITGHNTLFLSFTMNVFENNNYNVVINVACEWIPCPGYLALWYLVFLVLYTNRIVQLAYFHVHRLCYFIVLTRHSPSSTFHKEYEKSKENWTNKDGKMWHLTERWTLNNINGWNKDGNIHATCLTCTLVPKRRKFYVLKHYHVCKTDKTAAEIPTLLWSEQWAHLFVYE